MFRPQRKRNPVVMTQPLDNPTWIMIFTEVTASDQLCVLTGFRSNLTYKKSLLVTVFTKFHPNSVHLCV